jgi:serine/threonine protein kinase
MFLNNDYTRKKKIGGGNMGEVWLSEIESRTALERSGNDPNCAAKICTVSTNRVREAFLQEISVMYHLRGHPNIVKIIGFSAKPQLTLIMEFFPMGSLTARMADPKFEVSSEFIISVTRDIAQGIFHMHRLMIAHCDIKPDNVLLKQSNKNRVKITACITDLGISKVLSGKEAIVAGFEKKNLNGASLRYSAPEVIRAFEKISPPLKEPAIIKAGDVYSLAVTIYEMMCSMR